MLSVCAGNGADSDEGEAEAEGVPEAADEASGQALPTLDQAIAHSELIQVCLLSCKQTTNLSSHRAQLRLTASSGLVLLLCRLAC